MKILLCQINSKYIHSSLAVWYLFSAIKEKCSGEVVAEVFEATVNRNIYEVCEEILNKNADLISFSCYIWNIEYTKKLITLLYEKNPYINIILGGPEATFSCKELLEFSPSVKYVLRGEGEETLPALLSGKIIKGVCRKNMISDIADNVSYISPYSEEYFNTLGGRISYLETTRGCPFSCSFCLSGREDRLRLFDMETVKKNILKLAASGTQTVKFVDRTFNCNLSRAKEIIRFIICEYGKGIKEGICFHFEVAADLFDDELIELLTSSPAGLFQIEAGIQSFNEKTLEACTRKTDISKIKKNLKKLISSGRLHVHTDLIAGLSYEDYESFKNSFNEAYYLDSHMLQLGFLKYLKGSRIEAEKESEGAVFNLLAPYEIISNKWITGSEIEKLKDIEDLVERLYNSGRFRLTLKYLLKASKLSPFELFERLSIDLKGYEKNIPLNDFSDLLFEKASLPVSREALRDVMVCDFLSVNSSGRLPSSLYRFDKDLSKIRGELKGKWGSAMLYYGKKRAVAVCYNIPPHPVTKRYKLKFTML